MNEQRGFTLVEIIVSVTIFTVVVLAGIGAIISINSVNRRSQKIKVTMDNLNFALEGIARELRLGKLYDCDIDFGNSDLPTPQNCNGASSIAFRDNENRLIKYKLEPELKRIQKTVPDDPILGASFFDITSPDVQIDSLKFYVTGTAGNDEEQPRIIVTLGGQAGTTTPGAGTDFRLQTTIVQRVVDVQ